MDSSFGLGPNETNNQDQDAHAAWNPPAAWPTLSAAASLDGTANVPSAMQPTTPMQHAANWTVPNIRRSISRVVGNKRRCNLLSEYGTPCTFKRLISHLADFDRHILDTHIGAELKAIYERRLEPEDAQILFTEARVARAEDYALRCPYGDFTTMRMFCLKRHWRAHWKAHSHYPAQSYQWGAGLETGPSNIVRDIMTA